MIILITYKHRNPKTNREEIYVSHGVEFHSMRNVVLSTDPLSYYIRECGALYDENLGWILPDVTNQLKKIASMSRKHYTK